MVVSETLWKVRDLPLRLLGVSHSVYSGWAIVLVFAIQLTVVGLIFRAWIGPLILRSISKTVRVRSVSLRSVRGVFIRTASMTVRIDRVGLSYHSSADATRRFSFKVEGLHVKIRELAMSHPRPTFPSRRFSRLPTLADFAPSPMARRLWWLYSTIYVYVEPYARPVIRAFFVASTRVVIRCLPALTQVVDFELDRALITFSTLPEAHVAVRNITLSTTITFFNLESVIGTEKEVPHSIRQHQSFLGMTHLKARFASSAKRVWERAWGRTRGSASFVLNIQKVCSFADSNKWPDSEHIQPFETDVSQRFVASRFDFVMHSSHNSAMCFNVPGSTDFVAALRFGPRTGFIEEHSILTSLKLSTVYISVQPLMALLRATKDLRRGPETPSDIFQNPEKVSNPWNYGRRPRHGASKMSLFGKVEFSVKEIAMQLRPGSKGAFGSRSYTGHVRNLSVSFHLGEPSKRALQHDFLGDCTKNDPKLDADVLSILLSARGLTVHRRDMTDKSPLVRVISIGPVDLQGFATQWPPLMMSPIYVFTGDPNASLVVIKLDISSPQLSERLDAIGDLLGDLQSSKASNPAPMASRRIFWSVPRLKVDVSVNDVAACLIPVERNSEPSSSAVLSSTQCVISFSTYFKYFPLARPDLSGYEQRDYVPLEMVFDIQSILGPAFITILPELFNPDASNKVSRPNSDSSHFGDPILSLSAIELSVSGQSLGGILDDTNETVLDIGSTMADVRCVTDAVSIELWQPSALSSLKSISESLVGMTKADATRSRSQSGLLDRLPPGVSAHFVVEKIGIILTGKDLNPDEDLGLSRGIAIKCGIALQFCSLHDRGYFSRLPRRFIRAHDRQRLGLAEELLIDAISITSASKRAENKFALFRCIAWDTTIRTSVATEFAADHAYEAEEEDEELRSAEFVWLKNVEVDVLSSYHYIDDSHKNGHEHLQLSLRIPYIQTQLRLFDAYCALLALSTLRFIFGSDATLERRENADSIIVSFKASVSTIQALVKLPLQEQLCFRINNMSIQRSAHDTLGVEWGTLFIWVPVLHQHGMWEEFARLRSWKLSCARSEPENLVFTVEGEGARLCIPYGYVLADLILDLNVFFKCLRHLITTIASGQLREMPVPAPEDAKVVPIISVKIGCLSVEAADDPFESRLGLIWRAGFDAAQSRLERDEAFEAKVAAIRAAEAEQANLLSETNAEQRFTPQHTVSVVEAEERLLQVHAISWMSLHRQFHDEQTRKEVAVRRQIRGDHAHISGIDIDPLVPLSPSSKAPPLLRIILNQVSLHIKHPSFSLSDLPDYLHDLGNGLPRESQFTLLVPFHLNLSLGSTCVTLRDYPLPLLNIPQESPRSSVAWSIDTDLVVAEELGTLSSTVWKDCPVVLASSGSVDTKAMHLTVPKTTMPVKTYANPTIDVLTTQLTEFCWGISYTPALQDVMRIFDTLSTPPPDPSPSVGFWDKMRLILHCRAEVTFTREVHLNLKGSRDPYSTDGDGAGFAFCWSGNVRMSIGHHNPDNELLQVISDTMLVVIPTFDKRNPGEPSGDDLFNPSGRTQPLSLNPGSEGRRKDFRKVCAKFTSGIRWGIGFVLERTCGVSCSNCGGTFACRLFAFRPHYEVMLEPKTKGIPREKTLDDSFNEFRSDFIHLSTSLASSVRHRASSLALSSNSFHFTPKTFAHFWSWWDLFDRSLSIPIRQGNLFPYARPPSKKFGRHLATLKYRLAIAQLFISHIYLDDSRETWTDGITNCVGIKALVDRFEADMHQREQEAIVPGVVPNTTKKIRHKPFYAAEVKLVGLELRALLATFADSMKRLIDMEDPRRESRYKDVKSDENDEMSSHWFDMDDFVETDWKPTEDRPSLHVLPVASCPRFTYFKRSGGNIHLAHLGDPHLESSRFGNEDTHECLIGKELSVHRVQADIVARRISDLKQRLALTRLRPSTWRSQHGFPHDEGATTATPEDDEGHATQKKISQLERYIVQLKETDDQAPPAEHPGDYANYLMPSDISCPADWTEFDNVYQFHCPKFSLNNSTRDILTQYYYCSRARRGFEYHMATRAVKFIRDQANAYARVSADTEEKDKKARNSTGAAAQAAAHALKKILIGSDDESNSELGIDAADLSASSPMDGWSEGVSLNKSHFCLLLKPQIVLRSEASKDSVLVLAAVQATLQSFDILDTANISDPVSGRVMTRSHAVLSGLQTFSPSSTCPARHDGVPLEVLIDLRAESDDFDRLVPQTDAAFRYDKFNRLRLRNNVTSIVAKNSSDHSNGHLQHQTDLIDVQVPRLTVSANSKNFEAIANIITNLLLRSDSAHKTHLNKVETLLFSYDFTDLSSTADVVEGLQSRLRRAVERDNMLESSITDDDEQGQLERMKIKAHLFLLTEDLNLIFDAITLAQDKADDKHNDHRSALKVQARSREISWGMVDDLRDMIAKLGVREVDFSWLSRQDGSTVNKLSMGDLQAFDGSPDAEWPEILVKHREPSNHPLVKAGIFIQADWTVLAPVGGITIYEQFIVELHPMRLQLEARVGRSIMEYVWPARRDRTRSGNSAEFESSSARDNVKPDILLQESGPIYAEPTTLARASLDSPSNIHRGKRYSIEERRPTLGLTAKRLTSSRSFTDLRHTSRQTSMFSSTPVSSDFLAADKDSAIDYSVAFDRGKVIDNTSANLPIQKRLKDDAAEMKTRASQKTFILVRISSMHILLSFHKDGSFFCRDARIQTRDLQYRNQTWSFEELAEQFIPSDTSWRGWMRVALHQPLVPVLPVARELLSKTKWIATKGKVARQARRLTPAIKAGQPRTSDSPRSSEQSSSSESRGLVSVLLRPEPRKSRRSKSRQSTESPTDDGHP
ncbi:golgi-body localization protein domain-containing protein [Phellopilus nigrolimitatus]|nr:golgi-body localization protein domain-containing protein [Phellopilus nigrolimitatus]